MGGPSMGMGGRGGYNPIGGAGGQMMGGPPGSAPGAGGYPGPPGPYSAGPYGMAHGDSDMNAI